MSNSTAEDFSKMNLYPPIGLTIVSKPPCPQCVMDIHDHKDEHDEMFESFLNSVQMKTRSNHGKRKHNKTKRAKSI
jgi:hypothetical protein